MTPKIIELTRRRLEQTEAQWNATGHLDEGQISFLFRLATAYFSASDEAYELKLAAAGGEDVPGSANCVTAADVTRWREEGVKRERQLLAENERLRRALGCHIQADAYRETFPDSVVDAQGLRKSETWWRLMARCAVDLDSELADACGSAAHDIPEVLAGIETAVAAARAGLREKGGDSAA